MWTVSYSLNVIKSTYSVVCGSCSANSWYVPGYADEKVRMCDPCYKDWKTYKSSNNEVNKHSVFSSQFGERDYEDY
jgi:hypothetical protein